MTQPSSGRTCWPLLVIGLLRLGRFIAYIPAPVISGFATGIAPANV